MSFKNMAHVCTCMCRRNNERGPSINTYGTLGEAIVFAPRVLHLGGCSNSHRHLKEMVGTPDQESTEEQ